MKINIIEFLKSGKLPFDLGDTNSKCESILGMDFSKRICDEKTYYYNYSDGIELFFYDDKLERYSLRINQGELNFDISELDLDFKFINHNTLIHQFLFFLQEIKIDFELNKKNASADYFIININENIKVIHKLYDGKLFQIRVFK